MRAVLVGLILATGCGGGDDAATFTTCGADECASLELPIDDADPSLGSVSVAVVRRRALDPDRRIGSLLVNLGGPGVAGVDPFLLEYAGIGLFSTELLDRFDVVGFDWRGVGASEGATCLDDAGLDALFANDFLPDSPAEVSALDAGLAGFTAACQANVRPALLSRIDTEHAARDLDRIRDALGESTISYYGSSYGTLLGVTYARLFPDRVRAFVLDGPMSPVSDMRDHARDQAVGYERVLNRFFEVCAAEPTNAFHAPTAGEVATRFDAVLASLETAPLTSGGRTLGPTLAYFGIHTALRASSYSDLGRALADVEAGDPAALLELSDKLVGRAVDGRYGDFMHIQSFFAISCLDRPFPMLSAVEHQSYLDTMAATFPRMGLYHGQFMRACLNWPERPQVTTFGATTAPPMLVLAAPNDAATPIENANALLPVLGNGSYLVEYAGDGHIPGPRSACTRDAVAAFLLEPGAPGVTSCAAE